MGPWQHHTRVFCEDKFHRDDPALLRQGKGSRKRYKSDGLWELDQLNNYHTNDVMTDDLHQQIEIDHRYDSVEDI